MSRHEASDELHRRVSAFIEAAAREAALPEPFDRLACDLARFQAGAGAPAASLLRARGIDPLSLADADAIPAVPTDVFKLRRVACHAEPDDSRVFRTSGTTAGVRGDHPMRTTSTYERAAMAWGRQMLFPHVQRMRVLILAPRPEAARESSLGFMLELFAREAGDRGEWFVEQDAIDTERLSSEIRLACDDSTPVLLAGASFAFVHLLDAMPSTPWQLPAGSCVMQTGGFKGKSREVDASALRAAIAGAFGLDECSVVSEYGMTELSSQAYEGTLRELHGLPAPCGPAGVFFAPPWMRVSAVDPESLSPVAEGEIGIARIVDLANVDSAVAIQTADRIRMVSGGFEVLGRAAGAAPRGCSLGIDEILGAR